MNTLKARSCFLLIVALLLSSCSPIGLSGETEIDIPGDHNFRVVLRERSAPILSKQERREEGLKEYGFDPTEVRSKSAIAAYVPGEKITVPVEKYFCLDCPTVPQFGIQPFYEHYQHSVLFGYQVWNAYQECLKKPTAPTPAPTLPESPKDCMSCKKPCLWKPLTETRGGVAALLMPAEKYKGMKASVRGGPEKVIDTGCCNNGNRMHWYFSKRGSAFGRPIVIDLANGECIYVPEPSKRYE